MSWLHPALQIIHTSASESLKRHALATPHHAFAPHVPLQKDAMALQFLRDDNRDMEPVRRPAGAKIALPKLEVLELV